MGRLVLMLLVTLLRNGEALTGKTAGRDLNDAVITAAVKTQLATDQAVPVTKIVIDTTCGAVSLHRNST